LRVLKSSCVSRKKAGASFNCCFSEGNIGDGKTYSLKDTSMGVTSSSTDEGNGYSSRIDSCASICPPSPDNRNTTTEIVIRHPVKIPDALWRRSTKKDSLSSLSRKWCFFM